MASAIQPEHDELFKQLEAACWNEKMYLLNIYTPNPTILPPEVQAICDQIKTTHTDLPTARLLDMSEFEQHPDYYPQRYVVGYFDIMNMAIAYIRSYYQQLNDGLSRGG
jgi:hypothetical protein